MEFGRKFYNSSFENNAIIIKYFFTESFIKTNFL
jgi:hypothetical protein